VVHGLRQIAEPLVADAEVAEDDSMAFGRSPSVLSQTPIMLTIDACSAGSVSCSAIASERSNTARAWLVSPSERYDAPSMRPAFTWAFRSGSPS
jgi:hypothetical protein